MCAITSAGRCTCSIVNAIVAVLPEPVTPSSVWKRSPASMPSREPSHGGGLVGDRLVGGVELELRHDLQTLAVQAALSAGERRLMRTSSRIASERVSNSRE